MKNELYLVIGNHNTLIGNWEQVEITLKTFQNAKIPIRLSNIIEPNKINILIEDFNSYLTKDMLNIKKKFPKTRYILYVTEYLTKKNNRLYLNVFSKKDAIFRNIASIETFVFKKLSNTIDLSDSNFFLKFTEKFRRKIVRPILFKLFNRFKKSYDNEIMMARRQRCLFEIAHLFSLCISTTEAVLRGYSDLCSCPLNYLPVFVDKEKTFKNRNQNKKMSYAFFSGRLTPFRLSLINKLNKQYIHSYPLNIMGKYSETIIKDFNYKLNSLGNGVFGKDISIDANLIKKEVLNNSVEIIDETIYEFMQRKVNPAFEIYIPQDISWPYSSPNRTLLSIESGYLPLDYGDFNDHDINKVALKVDLNKMNDILNINNHELKKLYKNLDFRIDDYNKLQLDRLEVFKKNYKKIFHKVPTISEVSSEKSSGKNITTG